MRPTQAREKDDLDQKLAHDQQDDPHPGGPDDAAQLLGGRQVLGGVQIEGVEHDDPHQRGEGDDDGFTGRHELARIAQGVGGQQGHHHAEGVREGEPHGDLAVAAQRATAGRGCGMEPGLAGPGLIELLGGAGTVVVRGVGADMHGRPFAATRAAQVTDQLACDALSQGCTCDELPNNQHPARGSCAPSLKCT